MRLLVTGCGRSGTMWIAQALRSTGIDAGHERVFKHGDDTNGDWRCEVSWYAAPFTPLPDTYVVHLVRHPLIASMASRPQNEHTAKHIERWLPRVAGPVEWAAAYWLGWNALVTADETIRVEDVNAVTVTRLARLVDSRARLASLPPPTVNQGPYASLRLEWDDVPPSVREAGYRLGYLDAGDPS